MLWDSMFASGHGLVFVFTLRQLHDACPQIKKATSLMEVVAVGIVRSDTEGNTGGAAADHAIFMGIVLWAG